MVGNNKLFKFKKIHILFYSAKPVYIGQQNVRPCATGSWKKSRPYLHHFLEILSLLAYDSLMSHKWIGYYNRLLVRRFCGQTRLVFIYNTFSKLIRSLYRILSYQFGDRILVNGFIKWEYSFFWNLFHPKNDRWRWRLRGWPMSGGQTQMRWRQFLGLRAYSWAALF